MFPLSSPKLKFAVTSIDPSLIIRFFAILEKSSGCVLDPLDGLSLVFFFS